MNFDKNEKDDIHNYHAEECFYIELPKRGQCRWVGWTGGYERTGLYNANESYAALFQMDVLECDEMKQFIGNDEYILHSVDEHICSHRRRIIRRENLKIIHKKWDIELEQLKLNRKTLCCLKKSGIYTVDELVNPVPTLPITSGVWQAPHDMKGYGDTDEEVHRDIFRRGLIRIEMELEGYGKKVYYVKDPDDYISAYEECQYILVPERGWQEYQS